jgi:hypothetical protein
MDRDIDCIGCGASTSGSESCDECCPRGHTEVHPLFDEVTGDIEKAIRCPACPADYVRVHGRWFEAPKGDP